LRDVFGNKDQGDFWPFFPFQRKKLFTKNSKAPPGVTKNRKILGKIVNLLGEKGLKIAF